MVNSEEIAMLKSLLFIAGLAMSLSLLAAQPMQPAAKRMVVVLERMSAPVFTSPQLKAAGKCLKTANRFWYIANVGTIERPLLKGFCRKAQPISPFAYLV
ncbi:MAG: hypothetical protein NTV60_01265 [Candidatus Kaiserbacteria bacterium]|nr:hypothetical protein [Candidatus Kaiserbacteria bacterium]